jgi:hypothetical protein
MSVFKRGGVGKYYIQFVLNGKTYSWIFENTPFEINEDQLVPDIDSN